MNHAAGSHAVGPDRTTAWWLVYGAGFLGQLALISDTVVRAWRQLAFQHGGSAAWASVGSGVGWLVAVSIPVLALVLARHRRAWAQHAILLSGEALLFGYGLSCYLSMVHIWPIEK